MKTNVKLGIDKIMDVDGKGVINILTKHGDSNTISKVYYVPSHKHNFLSVGQWMQKGYKVIFQG